MRRDYFTCVFLLYIATALSFVCLLPNYFTYDAIVPRDIGLLERIISLIVVIVVILVVPIVSAIRKKLWISLGAATYGLLAYIPGMLLSKMDSVLSGSGANTFAVIEAFFLKAIYAMVNAPFAGVSKLVGNNFAVVIPKLIMPVSIITYIVVQLFRFYRDAYVAEQLSPVTDTHKVDSTKSVAREPEILGTVISAPVAAAKPVAPAPAPAPTPAPNSRPNPAPQPKQVTAPEAKQQIPAPEQRKVISVEATPKPAQIEGGETKVINLGAPKEQPKKSATNPDVIQLGAPPVAPAPKPAPTAPVVPPVAPKAPSPAPSTAAPKANGVIELGAPVKTPTPPQNSGVIQLGPSNPSNDTNK